MLTSMMEKEAFVPHLGLGLRMLASRGAQGFSSAFPRAASAMSQGVARARTGLQNRGILQRGPQINVPPGGFREGPQPWASVRTVNPSGTTPGGGGFAAGTPHSGRAIPGNQALSTYQPPPQFGGRAPWQSRVSSWIRQNPRGAAGIGLGGAALGGAGLGYALSPSRPQQPQEPYGRMAYAEESPMVNIDKLMDPVAAATLKTAGLHKIAAAMEKVAHGRDVGPEVDLPVAAHLIGERFFQKRAEHRQIQNGLKALRALRGE